MKDKRILLISSFVAVCLFFILAGCSKQDIETSASAFSNSQWTIIGPYDEPERDTCPFFFEDLLVDWGGERQVSNAGLPVDNNKYHKLKAQKGFVDFTQVFPGKSWAVAYAYYELEGNDEECFFTMGSDDGLRVWINGELVVDDHQHRALSPDSNSFRAVLQKGTNRILVKVCQGAEGWGFTLRSTTREEHEVFLTNASRIALSVSSPTQFIKDAGSITFSILANPAPLTDVPVSYSAIDADGNIITSGTGLVYEQITVPVPSGTEGNISIIAEPGAVEEGLTKEKLGKGKVESIFFRGDRDTIFPLFSTQARKAAQELVSAPPWTTLNPNSQETIQDIAPTLLYLADMIDGNLNKSLVNDRKQILALTYVADILKAMKKGSDALSEMTGYRQMAYRSDIDDSIQPYCLYLPETYSPERSYSLIVMLHGYSGDDYGWGNNIASLMPDDFIVVSVFGRGDVYYQSVAEQDVLDVMDRIIERYPVDENRVYLTGNSMGGEGTWRLGTLYAERFAAIAPYCGWTGCDFMENLGNMKVYVVHGDADTTVPVDFDRNCVKKLEKLGYDVTYVEIKNGTHSAWTEWSKITPPNTILEVFRSAERNPSPQRLAATVAATRYGKYYWITVNELDTSGVLIRPKRTIADSYDSNFPLLPKPGHFSAERSADGSIKIITERINALTVDVKTAGMNGTSAKTITIDKTEIDVPAGKDALHLAKNADNKWSIDSRYGTETFPLHEGGGVADLFTKPLIIVYGTQSKERTPILEAAARELADWSYRPYISIGVKIGTFTVKADTELTDEELSSNNILLFGTPDENSISRQFSESFEPYYDQGDISVGGLRFSRNALCLTIPNPKAPEKLLGYIDISRNLNTASAAKQYFLNFQFRLRNCYMNELMGYPTFCPDVFVMTDHPLHDAWSGWFNRYWENLEGREAGK